SDGINTQITSAGDGTFAFPGPLPPGNFALSADGPAGNSKPVALCTEARVGEFATTLLAHPDEGNNSVSIPVTIENSAILCTLLLYDPNGSAPGTTPGTTGTAAISIEARLCPEDIDSTDFGELDATCLVSDTVIDFAISGPTSLTQTTGATLPNGVSFPNLAPGTWTISEATPDGFGQAIVICAANDVNANTFGDNTTMDVEGGNTVTTDIAAGIDLRCTWFNTTADVSGTDSNGSDGDSTGSNANGATLILVLRTCPEGYNPDTAKADPMKECTEFKHGVNISATDSKNKKQRHKTGEDETGTATYTGLKSGIYRLHQGYPANVDHGFILDCQSDTRKLTPLFIPLARIDVTGSIKITLKAPETMTCNWFNIPNSTDDGDQSSNATDTNPQVTGNTESAGNATVSVTVRTCSGVPNPLACDPVPAGFSVSLTNVDGQSDPIVLVANNKGVAAGVVPAGTFSIDADTGFCLVSSAASTDDGSIQIPVEGEVKIDYYICT
ncbi:MAG TPA: hypothetical protein PK691_11540, partial [Thermomicrobiales bacterium]|nr:hypothetical protein [Thermomicrobiales bacterium]